MLDAPQMKRAVSSLVAFAALATGAAAGEAAAAPPAIPVVMVHGIFQAEWRAFVLGARDGEFDLEPAGPEAE